MKALDTSVLLAILHGDRNVRALLRRLRGVEVATTELNLLELHCLVGRAPPRGRSQRREALERLRRSLTVLPFDSKAAERAARRTARDDLKAPPPLLLGILTTLEANGCDELITADPRDIAGRWPFRITKLSG
ncbi:MAG: PIN domain-containing protein [Thermoplasmata archaeon]